MRVIFLTSISILVGLFMGGCENKEQVDSQEERKKSHAEIVKEIVSVEDLILDLTPLLTAFSQSLVQEGHLFPRRHIHQVDLQSGAELLAVSDLEEQWSIELSDSADLKMGEWPFRDIEVTRSGRSPWQALEKILGSWEVAKFGVLKGRFLDEQRRRFEMKTTFSGRSENDAVYGISAEQTLVWEYEESFDAWVLREWHQGKFRLFQAEKPFFENVTEKAIADRETYRAVIRSVHEEYLENVLRTGYTPVYDRKYLPFVDVDMNHATPSVSVVDVDQDGWEDLFVSSRWSPPKLLKNLGDGTFRDVSKEAGINIRALVNCSLFADFDNDGDLDVLFGRSLEPVIYMENREGIFHDVTEEKSDLGKLHFVSAISASDINRDGLVDFYLSTYGATGDNREVDWKELYLPKAHAEELTRRQEAEPNMWVEFPGPPNIIVMNRGDGRLEQVPVDGLASQWHNSFQSAWADFDGDGDDDLYVCNDFAPGGFLINETERGAATPRFRDGRAEVFSDKTMGFAMGASWSDFDHDGDLDLYVSNMYSKAGKRITGLLNEVDNRFVQSASGNYLYENREGMFHQIAGVGRDQIPVHKVGWSYGGQFADFSNNGIPDLYVPSGFVTAPLMGRGEIDL